MKALVVKGHKKYKGKEFEVAQWCNDWFSLNVEKDTKIVRPTLLAFTEEGIKEIVEGGDSGVLFALFRITKAPEWARKKGYIVTFKPAMFSSTIKRELVRQKIYDKTRA